MKYPKNRKSRLSRAGDDIWYPKSFIAADSMGTRRRYIEGPCAVCGVINRTTWANFSRKGRYHFTHFKCGQDRWNAGQVKASYSISPEDIANRIARKYQHGCRQRGIQWALSIVEVMHFTQSDCFYCGAAPSGKIGKFTYTGIDRMHNDRGYTISNCVSCCRTCNFLKRDMPYADWVAFLRRIRGHWTG